MVTYLKSRLNDVRFSRGVLFIGALLSVLWSAYFSVITITIPYQIELREGAALVITRMLLSRGNPYTFENQPLAMNIYGLGYNLAVLPFAALFGNTLLVHRAVTFAFIVLSAVVVYVVAYKAQKDSALALAAGAFVMIALIGHGGIGAFSSATGTFLLFAAVFIPFFRSFDAFGLVLSVIFSLVAFYTKPYFVLSFGVVVSYLFLFVSKRKALAYSFLFLVLFVVAFIIVRSVFPLYFFNTIITNISMTWRSYAHLFDQLSSLFLSFIPIVILSLFAFAMAFLENRSGLAQTGNFRKSLNLFEWRRPLIGHAFDFCLYFFLCALIAFVFILGPHMGNSMNYAYQLLVPAYLCWFVQKLAVNKRLPLLLTLLVLFNLFAWQNVLLDPRMLEQKNSREWSEFFAYIRSSSNILNSQIETSEVVRLGLNPVDAGQTIVYYQVKPFSDNFLVDASYESVVLDGFKYVKFIDQSIERQKFDLVVVVAEKGVFYHVKRLGNYYVLVDKIELDMPQTGQHWMALIWKPKPK